MITVTDIGFAKYLEEDSIAVLAPLGDTPITKTSSLKASVGEYISVGIEFEVAWGVEDIDLIFEAPDTVRINKFDPNASAAGYTGGDSPNSNNLQINFFDFFSIDDEISFDPTNFATSSNATVVRTIKVLTKDKIIFQEQDIVDEPNVNTEIYGLTDIGSLDFVYNIIENQESIEFKSRITDLEENSYFSSSIDATTFTPTTLVPTGAKNWQTGFASDADSYVKGNGIVDGRQKFILIHNFHLIDLTALDFDQNGKPSRELVDELAGSLSQKYVFDIRVKTDVFSAEPRFSFLDDANKSHYDQILKKGNTGFFDEIYNGYSPAIGLGSLQYKDSSGADVDALQTNDSTTAFITINSLKTGGLDFFYTGSFDEGIAQLVVMEVPTDSSITDVTKTYFENTSYSRVMFSWNKGSILGSQQIDGNIITSLNGTRVSDSQLDLELEITPFNGSANGEYIIFFSSVGYDSEFSKTVTQSVLVDSNTVITQFPSGYISTTSSFKQHGGFIGSNLLGSIEDNILSLNSIVVDKSVVLGDTYNIDLQGVDIIIEAQHATDSSRNFIVQKDTFNANSSSYGTTSKGYELTSTDEFNKIVWNEEYGSETPTQKTYSLDLPIKLRWEEWVSANADSDFVQTDFQDWAQFEQHADWELVFKIDSKAKITNQTTGVSFLDTISNEVDFELQDYGETCAVQGFTATYTNLTIDLQDNNSLTPLSVLVKDRDILVTATFEGDWANTPSYPFGIYGILRLDAKDVGGISYNREISTEIDVPSGSEWSGVTNPLRTDINIDAGTGVITLKAIIDGTKLDQSVTEFCLSARIGAKAS